MRKKPVPVTVAVFLGKKGIVCKKCLHERIDEPYVVSIYRLASYRHRRDFVCWRCCRDAESTLLIKQKWPLAFTRTEYPGYYRLDWHPGVKALIGKTDETQSPA